MPKLKLAICIPCYGDPDLMFMKSLQEALCYFYESRLTNEAGEEYEKEVRTFIVASSMLAESRHRLVADATKWGADFMLFCDADHIFPREAICRLWARNKQVVGCNYARRCRPTAPTAAKIVTDDKDQDHKNLVYTTQAKAEQDVLEEVSHVGLGLVLIRMDVFDQVQLHAEQTGEGGLMPLFVFEPTPDKKGVLGEDVYFFRKLRAAGVKVWCDHSLSWDVGHITKMVLSNAHAVAQEKDWIAETRALVEKYEERIAELERAA